MGWLSSKGKEEEAVFGVNWGRAIVTNGDFVAQLSESACISPLIETMRLSCTVFKL